LAKKAEKKPAPKKVKKVEEKPKKAAAAEPKRAIDQATTLE